MKQKKKTPRRDTGRQRRPYGGRPSRKEAELLHGRILDAAAELFTKHGYGETSIDAIATHAGIGKLTLYRRFGNKETLFQAVVVRLSEKWRAEVSRASESEGSLSEALAAAGRLVLSAVLSPSSLAFHRILFAEAARLPRLCALMYQEPSSDSQDPIRAIFRRFADRGELRVDHVAFLDQQFVQSIIGKPLRNALLGAPPMNARAQEEHVRKAVDLFFHGPQCPAQTRC
jgi:TetR/AcrR family transcriptional repressor of mexJK operon